ISNSLQPESYGTADMAGLIKVVLPFAYRPVILVGQVDLFMATRGIEMVEDNLPYPTTDLCQSEAITSRFAEVVNRRYEGKAITPSSLRQRPCFVSAGQEIDG